MRKLLYTPKSNDDYWKGERTSLENILSQHTSQSVLTLAKTKIELVDVRIFNGVFVGSYELLIGRSDKSVPHTVYIGEDDIWCSCVGYTSSLKEKKLCSHLVIGLIKLVDASLLNLDDVQNYLHKWTER